LDSYDAADNFSAFLVLFISEKIFGLDDSAMNNMTFFENYGGVTNFIFITVVAILIFALSFYFLRKEFKK